MASKKANKKKANKNIKRAPRKETTDPLSSLASKAMRDPKDLTPKQIKSLGASVLSQDETKGERKK